MADTEANELAAMASGIAAGDQQAWTALVERYTPLVWSIVKAHRLTPPEGADVTQNVWLMLVEHISSLREPAQLPGWLATTARREALRTVRQRALTHQLDTADEPEDANPSPHDIVETNERTATLHRALRQLSPRCQTILSLIMAEPRPSYDQISAALNMPIGSIGPMRARCLAHLRRLLAHEEGITETELLKTLRSSELDPGEVPPEVIDKANEALVTGTSGLARRLPGSTPILGPETP